MKGLSKKQEKFKWNSDYSVNVKEIDDQHKVILEFINSLNDKVFNGVAESFIGKNLREMEEYVERHFVMEEKYFTQFNYAGAEDHIREHNAYKEKIKEFKQKSIKAISGDDPDYLFELISLLDLGDWWISHVLYNDKKYSKCFNDHGLI